MGSNLKGVEREKREGKTTGVHPRYVQETEISNESCAVSVSFSSAPPAAQFISFSWTLFSFRKLRCTWLCFHVLKILFN